MKKALILFVVWWVALNLFAVGVFFRFRITEPDTAYGWIPPESGFFPARWMGFVDLHMRWDSGFFVWIAADGYYPDNAAFLPLYPWLTRAVERMLVWMTGHDFDWWDWSTVAFVVANLSAAVACVLMAGLARLDYDEPTALRAALFLLLFPAAFFLTTVYSEPLFVALALASFYAARRGRWWLAGLLGGLTALTRAVGVMLLLPLAVEYIQQRRTWRPGWDALGLLLVPAAFLGFHWLLRAQGLSFFDTQANRFGRPLVLAGWNALVTHAAYAGNHPPALVNLALDLAVTLFVLGVSVVACWKVRLSYGLWGILVVLAPALTGPTTVRYALPAFVVPLACARWGRNPWIERAYVGLGAMLLGYYTMLFVQGYWAG